MTARDRNARVDTLPVYVTRADVARLLATTENTRNRWIIELLWRTGARVSELVAARVGDLTDRGIRLANRKQHRHAEKHVFLTADFLERLRAYVDGLPAEWPIIRHHLTQAPLTPRRVEQIIRRAAIDADIYRQRRRDEPSTPIWPHTFRHGAAVHLLLNGAPVTAAQRQLGHASLAATNIYTKIADADMERVIERVEF